MSENKNKVLSGEMTHIDFLKASNNYVDFQKWCESHGVEPDESNAEFYFDQTNSDEYKEEDVLMEM